MFSPYKLSLSPRTINCADVSTLQHFKVWELNALHLIALMVNENHLELKSLINVSRTYTVFSKKYRFFLFTLKISESRMEFYFDKAQLLDENKALRKEWLLTNGLGSYASSTVFGCNTRKYHGLLNVNLACPPSRYVLLSTLEEALVSSDGEYNFSTRKHPDLFYPTGHEHLDSVQIKGFPSSTYVFEETIIHREVLMVQGRNITLIKYFIECTKNIPFTLKVRPLLAFREMHALTYENDTLNPTVNHIQNGISVKPYEILPRLYMSTDIDVHSHFIEDGCWCKNVQYSVEEKRGFDSKEDLYSAGYFEIPVLLNTPIYFAASTEEIIEPLSDLWVLEAAKKIKKAQEETSIYDHLKAQSETFVSKDPSGNLEIVAGYPWFQAWGRDTLIALPGTCLATKRIKEAKEILLNMVKHLRYGLLPNMFSADGKNSYNTVDSSLWFVWAVQNLEIHAPVEREFLRSVCYPAIKAIIEGYTKNAKKLIPSIKVSKDGLLYVGTKDTQLTWMDAQVDGKPVTPRYGYVVEINALWFNALAYASYLSRKFKDPFPLADGYLKTFPQAFKERFWTNTYGGYLCDVATDSFLDLSIRPNQLFAVSLPYSPLEKEEQIKVVEIVRSNLLTPYGLRTLSKHSMDYKGKYEGNSTQRDSAYHQGTVWPWLLGAYSDALIKVSDDKEKAAKELLNTIKSLYGAHLSTAGIGSISEIFSANPPQLPDGCIAQAWSVGECFRLIHNLRKIAPKEYEAWEAKVQTAVTKG